LCAHHYSNILHCSIFGFIYALDLYLVLRNTVLNKWSNHGHWIINRLFTEKVHIQTYTFRGTPWKVLAATLDRAITLAWSMLSNKRWSCCLVNFPHRVTLMTFKLKKKSIWNLIGVHYNTTKLRVYNILAEPLITQKEIHFSRSVITNNL